MSKLEDFLGLTDISTVREKISKSIGGKTLDFEVRLLTHDEHTEFMRMSRNPKTGALNSSRYNELTLEACVVEPNFRDADFLRKAGCHNAVEFWKKKFPAGFIADLAGRIQELSGFSSMEMDIEEAKN